MPAVASLAGSPVAEVRPLLAELTDAHLAVEPVPGRFAVHDLLRAYAAELAGECGAATRRLLDHYLHTADAADRLLVPDREPLPPAAPGVTVEPVADPMAWFAAEHAALVAAVTHRSHAAPLARRLTTYFDRHAHWRDWAMAERAAALHRDAGERGEEAQVLIHLGDAHAAAGDPGRVAAAWQAALATLAALDHPGADQVRTRLDGLPTMV